MLYSCAAACGVCQGFDVLSAVPSVLGSLFMHVLVGSCAARSRHCFCLSAFSSCSPSTAICMPPGSLWRALQWFCSAAVARPGL